MKLEPVFARFLKGTKTQYQGERFEFQVMKTSPVSNEQLINIRASDGEYHLALLTSEGNIQDYQPGAIWSAQIDSINYLSAKSGGLRPVVWVNGLRKVGDSEVIGRPTGLSKETLARVVGLTLEQVLASEAPPGYDQPNGDGSAPSAAPAAPAAAVSEKPKPKRALPSDVVAIEGITPYLQVWKMRARAGQKSDMRTFQSKRGQGKLFNVTFIDETGEIRATFFNEDADKFYDLIRDGSVYYVSKARVSTAKRQFSNVNNDFEIMADSNTVIEPCSDDEIEVPAMHYNFVKLKDLPQVENNKLCDVLTVVKDIFETTDLVSKKTSRPYSKRDILLVDDSGVETRCTLWGDEAKSFDVEPGTVVAFKGLKVSDFGGRSLSALRTSGISPSPDLREAYKLKGWYDAEGRNKEFVKQEVTSSNGETSHRYVPIYKIIEENLGSSQREFVSTMASIQFVYRRGLTYPACPSENCNKKVIMETNHEWRCEKCDTSYPEPQYRYIISVRLADGIASDGIRVSIFDALGQKLLGMPAKEIHEYSEQNDEVNLSKALSPIEGKTFTFRLSASLEQYGDNETIKYQAMGITPIETECAGPTKYLLEEVGL